METSEIVLLKRFAYNGDAEAFAEIVQLHAPLVYGVCLRILEDSDKAADAVQDTFLQLAHDAKSISGSLSNWLHRVATHKAIDLIRRDLLRKKSESKYVAVSEKMPSAGESVTWNEISVCIDKELDNLDDQTREVIIRRFFRNQTTSDIAAKCGLSQPTVSRRLESGIALLRHKLRSRGVIVPAVVLAAMLSENIVRAAPAVMMKELGKIAISGGQAAAAATGTTVTVSAVKAKIVALATVAVIVAGSVVLYKYYTQPAEPTDVQQTDFTPYVGRVAYSSPLSDLFNSISESITGSQVGLIAGIYNISDLAKTDDEVNSIIARIKKDVEPKSWYDNNKKAGGTIIAYNSRQTKNLTIRASQETHEKIAELLKSMLLSSELD